MNSEFANSELAPVSVPPEPTSPDKLPSGFLAGASAAAITVPHSIGLGLLAFAPLSAAYAPSALALWSAALPGAVLALAAHSRGVIYAPTTAVALLFGGMLALVALEGPALGIGPAQALAVTGAAVAVAFALQWLLASLRVASLARFLPVPVTQGFAAGVGLSMMLSQLKTGFGAGGWHWEAKLAWHGLIAVAVMLLASALAKRWRGSPALLLAIVIVAAVAMLAAPHGVLVPSAPALPFMVLPLPDWVDVPWFRVVQSLGPQLFSLALLMAIVNSLDVLVFHQELHTEHGLRNDPNKVLQRESLLGIACAVLGMIPAATSASRSRTALQQAGRPTDAGLWHAGLLIVVALTGFLWLPWLPLACLAGALLLTGARQIPLSLWTLDYARRARTAFAQSWVVAFVFAVVGGGGALVAGLVVATFSLLQVSAGSAIRRVHVVGQVRSRRLRHMKTEAWIAERIEHAPVFELQGIISFGVAAHVCEKVRSNLAPQHRRVVVDASRVPAWDETGYSQFRALGRDLAAREVMLILTGISAQIANQLHGVRVFADLDRALEWIEDELVKGRPFAIEREILGELGEGLSAPASQALGQLLVRMEIEPHSLIFTEGDLRRELIFVHEGRVTLATSPLQGEGLRLAKLGRGMAFGEMAFLSDIARTANAMTETLPAKLGALSRSDFDRWAMAYPDQALIFMSNLAQVGIRRLSLTTRQLRNALE
ncbi:MAG: SulP family inorganic anion transporter, partial [Burkholderiaceae bacterium]